MSDLKRALEAETEVKRLRQAGQHQNSISENLRSQNRALRHALREMLQVQDGVPMMGIEATRRGEAARTLLDGPTP